MRFYQDGILPFVIDMAMRRGDLNPYRGRVVPAAEGRILEIGVGSGLNLPFYSQRACDRSRPFAKAPVDGAPSGALVFGTG
jgi:hypothetical protein